MGAFFGILTLILQISMVAGGLMLFHKLKKEKSIFLKIAAYLLTVAGVIGILYTGYYAGRYCLSGSCPAGHSDCQRKGHIGMMMNQEGMGPGKMGPGMMGAGMPNREAMMGLVSQCMQQMPKNKKMDAKMMAKMQSCMQAQGAASAPAATETSKAK